ncbi:hypothetical protein [Micromonospora sp. WMMD1219]|uniref:hypothetical protein n=1 Tax=Micromonospora sp. WMMD1219 TaxID=3404115 RepID=UPI003BF49E7E
MLVSTPHRRGAHAIGGMAVCSSPAGIPRSMRQPSTEVRADKRRKAGDGFDGSGVAHPGLVATCREEFHVLLGDRRTSSTGSATTSSSPPLDCGPTSPSRGATSTPGLGAGAVALGNLVEDGATAEIARCQIWQWLDHATPLANDGTVTDELVRSILAEELARRKVDRDSDGRERAGAGRANRRGHRARGGSAAFFTAGAYARYLGPGRGSSGSAC